jgi:hypothetical protein
MKRILSISAVMLFILVLSKLASNVAPSPPPGTAFALKAEHVIACSSTEVILADEHNNSTRLDIDSSWPECSTFQKNETLDFYLSRGDKTHFISDERTAWWRKIM